MKKFLERCLGIGLTLVLVAVLMLAIISQPLNTEVVGASIVTGEAISDLNPSDTNPIEEITKRTATSKTYIVGYKGNGIPIYQFEASLGAIHYKDSTGQWQDIDPNYSEADSGGYTAKFTKLPFAVRMKNDGTRRIYPDRNDLSYWIELGKPISSMGNPIKAGNTWKWDFKNATTIVKLQNQAVKFDFILKNSNAPNTITIPFSAQGITRVGNLLYHDGQVVGELRKPTAIDAVGIERDCQVTWNAGSVTLTLDTTGLTYPIDIDPTWEVLAATDDVWVDRTPASESFDKNSVSFEAGYGAVGDAAEGSAARFLNINIPAASTINLANLILTAKFTNALTTVNSSITAELNNTPITFDNVTEFNARVWTTANVTWDNIAAWTLDAAYSSPDIKTVIQEVVDNPGWAAGNPMVILWEDWGQRSTQNNNRVRTGWTYDSDPTKAPRLLITFTGSLTDAYWVGDAGDWSDDDNHWAPVSGGIPGDGNIPSSTTNVHFDANSFSIGGQTVTVDAAANVLDMDWTGATNTPTLAGSAALNIYGSATFISAMNRTYTGTLTYRPATAVVLTSNGSTSLAPTVLNGAGSLQLADNFTLGGAASLTYTTGSFDANGQVVDLVGTAHTVSGNWTFTTLRRTGTATKTDTLTMPSSVTVTCDNFTIVGNSPTNRLLVQSSTLGTAATINATNFIGTRYADFMDITSTNAVDLNSYLYYDGNDVLSNGVANFRIADSSGAYEAWFRTSTTGANQILFSSADTLTANWMPHFYINTNDVLIFNAVKGGVGSSVTGSTNVVDGQWHHIVLSSSGTAWSIFLDGVAETLTPGGGGNNGDWFADIPNRDNLTIGARTFSGGTGLYMDGDIGWTRFYSRQMLVAEAIVNTKRGMNMPASDVTGLVYNLPLTEGVGNPVDTVGSLTMAVTGATWTGIGAGANGDAGGNTNITFDASIAQTWDGTTGDWDDATKWAGRVPLPQDAVSAGGAGNTITVDMPRVGGNVTFTGTPIVSLSNDISNYGLLTLVSGMTYTHNNNTNILRGRGAYTLISAGKTFYNLTLSAPSGTYTEQDGFTASNIFALTNGTLVDGGFTNTLSGTGAITKWNATGGAVTLTGTIILTNSGANAQTFAGNGFTYNNVTVEGAGNYALTITGSNTFNTFTVDRSVAAKTILFTDGTTQTMADFVCATSGATVATLNGTGVGGWNIAKSGGGLIAVDYMSITNSAASPATTWYAGVHSTDEGGNTGWLFYDPVPIVVTNGAISANTTSFSFLGSGNITTIYSENAAIVGFEYGLVSTVYTDNVTSVGSYGIGNFLETISSLSSNTTYFFRALAVNSGGAGYGAEDNVTTFADVLNLRAVPTSDSFILTWQPAGGSSNTTILYSTTTYPTSMADGTVFYTGSGYQATLSDLTLGQVYYFSAWGGVGAPSATNTHLAMTTLATDIPSGAELAPTSLIPIPALPTTIDQSASVPPGSNLEPFTTIFLFFTSGNLTPADNATAGGGLGMPIGNVWEILAVLGIVTSGMGVYIKLRNFFIAFFVVLVLTIVAVAFQLMQAWLVPVEIIIGLGVWSIDKYYQ